MYLLFEVGGTNTRIGFSSDGENIQDPQIIPTSQNFEDFLTSLQEKAKLHGDIKTVAGGMPVVFDKDKACPIASAHLPNWVGKTVKKDLEDTFGCPVFLENETALGALGEATNGAGKGYPIVAYFTIGTGVGSARIVDGKIDRKSYAFEAGHQIIVQDGDPCTCGGKGHWEAYVGGWYLEKRYGQKASAITDPKVWDEVARYTGLGLYNSTLHWSPDLIVLGGSVSESISLEEVASYLKEFSTIEPVVPLIVKAVLKDRAGLYGALIYLRQNS